MSKPREILIVGGSRWARQMAGELILNYGNSIKIDIFSKTNYENMNVWASDKKYSQYLYIKNKISLKKSNYFASIIVNSANDHYLLAKESISNRIPTLVEKPVTLSWNDSKALSLLAEEKKTILCSANVYLFSKLLNSFSKIVNKNSEIQEIELNWFDPKIENRYGESKRQDLSISVSTDVLPHVLSILKVITLKNNFQISSCNIYDSLNKASINISIDNISCKIKLIRFSESRKRTIKVKTVKDIFLLDFTNEDHHLFINDLEKNDLINNKEDKPLILMLKTFINNVESKNIDPFLNIGFGLTINKVIDDINNLISLKS